MKWRGKTESTEISSHHSDIFPGILKTRIFIATLPDGKKVLRKVYQESFEGVRPLWEKEQLFNERVENWV